MFWSNHAIAISQQTQETIHRHSHSFNSRDVRWLRTQLMGKVYGDMTCFVQNSADFGNDLVRQRNKTSIFPCTPLMEYHENKPVNRCCRLQRSDNFLHAHRSGSNGSCNERKIDEALLRNPLGGSCPHRYWVASKAMEPRTMRLIRRATCLAHRVSS